MKVSSMVLIALIVVFVLLGVSMFKPNTEIIKVLGDTAKVLSGALAGAIAGEKYEK